MVSQGSVSLGRTEAPAPTIPSPPCPDGDALMDLFTSSLNTTVTQFGSRVTSYSDVVNPAICLSGSLIFKNILKWYHFQMPKRRNFNLTS